MCAQFISGPPIIHCSLVRPELISKLANSDANAILIVAPSGYGKTVLAAQYSQEFERVCWVNCSGQSPDLRLVGAGALKLLHSNPAVLSEGECLPFGTLPDLAAAVSCHPFDGVRRLVVIDDADLCEDEAVLEHIWLMAQVLSQANYEVVLTAPSVPTKRSSRTHKFGRINYEDLKLAQDEALTLAQESMHLSLCPDEINSVWAESKGHVAFFVVMTQARHDGVSLGGSSRRLSAWIDHVLESQLSSEDAQILLSAALLKRGRVSDIAGTDSSRDAATLGRCAEVIPLVHLNSSCDFGPNGRSVFVVHDLLVDHLVRHMTSYTGCVENLVSKAVEVLTLRGDLVRAAEIVQFGAIDGAERFLVNHGAECLKQGGAEALVVLIDELPMSVMMASPQLMLLWSDALLECDDFSEAISKARAARVLASHQGELVVAARALANSLVALRRANRWSEASQLMAEARDLASHVDDRVARAALHRAAGALLALTGIYQEASFVLRAVIDTEGDEEPLHVSWVLDARVILAMIPAFAHGDFSETARHFSSLARVEVLRNVQRTDIRGNLATSLTELGRIDRAVALFAQVINEAPQESLSHFLPAWGVALFCDGDEDAGLQTVSRGVKHALDHSSDAVAAQTRVYEAILLRAYGRVDESLTSAERAYERLCTQDFVDFRRLAALEIAASLLALGDSSAARAWVDPVVAAGFGPNEYHRFRATMILAECDRREGNPALGVNRLAEQAKHLRSENSNFQAAMYCRAFPALLGMITAAVGAAEVPVHMLKLIPAEAGERALRSSQDLLPEDEWAALGGRLLGAEQFDAFVQRKGSPICRVKLFGGLEVTVGDRSVQEKDWRKRKARMLFAILVVERGRQLSREQLLEHVWPDLPEPRAKNNFYVAWSNMKSALMAGVSGPCLYVENTGGLCQIVRDAVRSDVDEFEEYMVAAREAEANGESLKAIEAYKSLSAGYRGELLPGDLYDEWFAPIRDRYRIDFVASMLRLVHLLLEHDEPCEAIVYARRALAIDPCREDLYQAVLKCQIAAGQRSAAIETFVTCKTQIAEELGLDPSPETVALYQQILCMEGKPRYDDFGLNPDES